MSDINNGTLKRWTIYRVKNVREIEVTRDTVIETYLIYIHYQMNTRMLTKKIIMTLVCSGIIKASNNIQVEDLIELHHMSSRLASMI